LYKRVRPIDRAWPEEATIHHQRGKDLVIRVALLAPKTHAIATRWRLEPKIEIPAPGSGGTVAGAGKGEVKPLKPKRVQDAEVDVEGVKIDKKDLDKSVVVIVDAWDPTPWVQRDDEGVLKQTRRWTVEVE
jgi:hypothetical protein